MNIAGSNMKATILAMVDRVRANRTQAEVHVQAEQSFPDMFVASRQLCRLEMI